MAISQVNLSRKLASGCAALLWLAALPVIADTAVVASVLPSSRSVTVNTPATLFSTVLNAGSEAGENCRIELQSPISGQFDYQTTNPATNAPTGIINTPVAIPVGSAQTFVLTLTPDSVQAPIDAELNFLCDNAPAATTISGLNTFAFAASNTPIPDVIALVATISGNGVVELADATASNAFSVASINVGAAGLLDVTASTSGISLPVSIALCQTDPLTSLCINPTTPTTGSVQVSIDSLSTPTFGVFVTGGADVPFDPATNRISVRFADAAGDTRGATGVAVRTLPPAPASVDPSVVAANKQLSFSWAPATGASFYQLLQRLPGQQAFAQVGADNATTSQIITIAVHEFDFEQTEFRVDACNAQGCTPSAIISAQGLAANAVGFFKASNAEPGDFLTQTVVSADGTTVAAVAISEDSAATGVNGDQSDNSASDAGAVYVFRNLGDGWEQEAYIKAAAFTPFDLLGRSMSISADGNTLAFGVQQEDSGSIGIGGDPSDDSGPNTGAVYVFSRSGSSWQQQEFIKASNPGQNDFFGKSVSLSSDGNTLVVGAFREDSSATGVDGNETNNNAPDSGAAYVFTRSGIVWTQQAYLKASNTEADDEFGGDVEVSGDGTTIAVGANLEDGAATGINGDDTDNSANGAGAVYVFNLDGGVWSQQA